MAGAPAAATTRSKSVCVRRHPWRASSQGGSPSSPVAEPKRRPLSNEVSMVRHDATGSPRNPLDGRPGPAHSPLTPERRRRWDGVGNAERLRRVSRDAKGAGRRALPLERPRGDREASAERLLGADPRPPSCRTPSLPWQTVPVAQTAALLDDLNANQRRAVESDASPLCVLAGAGSGKTRVLTRRIAHRIATGSAGPDHVLALTFTRKAAGELGNRLRTLGVRDRVAAGTFHAVAYAQLRRRWADRDESEPALLDRKVRLLLPLLRSRGGGQPADLAAEIEWARPPRRTPPGTEKEP